MITALRVPAAAGIGLRLSHLEEAVATHPPVPWFEIHPENFVANPHATELLLQLADAYPIAVHTVGLSVGSVTGLDRHHLARVRRLVNAVDPFLVSGHLAWSTHGNEYLNDLLPLPYTEETLRLVSRQLREVQDELGRPYALENPSAYVGFTGSTMTEGQFLAELVDRTGCPLLCDVSNVFLSAHNMGYDAGGYLADLPGEAIAEFHLGGFTPEEDEATPGGELLIDTHASRVSPPAWDLYEAAIERFGPRPTLIEWDNEIPPLAILVEEARRADEIRKRAYEREVDHGSPA